jgi:hypothetical protein
MSDYQIINPIAGMQNIGDTSTTQNQVLGTIVQANDTATTAYGAGMFIYLSGVASTVLGSWVTFNQDDNTTTLLAANAIGPVGISMSINVASQYGWYQIYGKGVGLCLTGYADNGLVYATSTAGSIDDAVVSGDRVKLALGASATGTPSSGFAEFEIQNSFMDDGSSA